MRKFYTSSIFLALMIFTSDSFAQKAPNGDIWLHLLTTGAPLTERYLGDQLNSGSTYYINFEVGQTTWNQTDAGIGLSNTDPSAWTWKAAIWYQDGSGSNKKVQANFGDFRFTSIGKWYFNGRAKGDAGDAFHYANTDQWGNSSTFAPVYYFTVNALNNPSSQTATINSTNPTSQIDLAWNKDTQNHNVMIVRKKSTDSWTEPTQGTAYAVGTSIGNGIVVYNSNGTSYSNTDLTAGTGYDYKFYSENYSYYSAGIVASTVYTRSGEPTTQCSNITFSTINSTNFYINWTNGNGGYTLIVLKDGSAPMGTPSDGYTYNANGTFGNGDAFDGGFVVVNSSVPEVTHQIGNLQPNHTYYAAIYSYNKVTGQNGTENYLVSSPATASVTTPQITVTPTSLTGFSYYAGYGPSSSQSYSVSGTNLYPASGNINISGSSSYEVSTDNSSFGSSKSIAYTGSALSSTNVYVRLKAGLSVGSYNGENVSNFGGGIVSPVVYVACSGSVSTYPAPTAYVVTGGGSYCQGSGGLPVGVANSETGVTYTISPGGQTVAGNTGNAISFGTRTAGTYTVSGTSPGGTTAMTGNAIITENSTGTWLGGSTGTWETSGNWCGGVPSAITDVTIPGSVSVEISSSSPAYCNNLTINTGGVLIVDAGQALTVSGSLLNDATNGILLKSPSDIGAPGSLITNGSVTGSGTLKAERYIPAYTSNLDGWHLISSPVSNPTISSATNLTPSTNDDFYKWDETQNLWLNQKVDGNNITSMITGTGYLVAYASASSSRYMIGTPNNSDVSYSNLTITPATPVLQRGWHLIGNPYPCAITWNNGSYALDGIGGVAKIMGNLGGYTDVSAGGIIPAMQGFSVQATNTTNSFIIPKTARTHSTTSWTKSSEANGILITANDLESQMVQENWIRINDKSTEGYDQEFDSHFLPLYAPHFYSKVGDEMLSTNSLPALPAETIIPFGFVKNESTQFSIELKQNIDGFTPYLKDLKTNTVQNLSENPVYTFTSEAGDDPNRFELSFMAPTGLDKTSTKSSLRVYTTTGKINISGMDGKAEVLVRNMMGQVVMRNSVNGEKFYSINSAKLPAGVYVVSVVSGRQTVSEKVVVK